MTRVTLIALLGFVAGLTFQGAFRLGDIAMLCAAAAVASAAVVSAAGRLHLRLKRVSQSASVLVGGLVGWIALIPALSLLLGKGGDRAGGYPTVLWRAVTEGPHRLLTTPPAAQGSAEMLALIGTCVWWATFWSALATLVSAPPLLAVLPPAILAAAGSAASAGVSDPHAALVAAGFGLLVVLHLWVEQSERSRPSGALTVSAVARVSRRTALISTAPALSALAAVAVLAVAVGPHLPGLGQRRPWDPRILMKPPIDLGGDTDPLSQAVAWMRSDSPDPLFTQHSTVPDQLTRWLVLDVYDGRRWSSSASYAWAGASIPKPSAEQVPTGPTQAVHMDVHVDSLPGPWLPAPGTVRSVTAGAPARVDTTLGALAAGTDGSVAALDYAVDADVAIIPAAGRLAQASAGGGGTLDAERVLPAGVPDDIRKWTLLATAGLDPYEQLKHLATTIKDGFRYDRQVAAGPSYGRLDWLLQNAATSAAGKPVSTSPDVVATLFAVAAREAGFPTRLVVGFQPPTPGADGRSSVTAADARIWPEAYFSGVGWVPFADAMPLSGRGQGSSTTPVQLIPTGPTSLNAPTTSASQGAVMQQPRVALATHAPKGSGGGLSSWWLIAPAVPVGAGGIAGGVVLILRRRRRAERRRDPDPRRRILWAWHDGLRWLAAANDDDAKEFATSTPREIAAAAAARWGTDGAGATSRLADLAEAALYAPQPPLFVDADQAWACADEMRALRKRRH